MKDFRRKWYENQTIGKKNLRQMQNNQTQWQCHGHLRKPQA